MSKREAKENSYFRYFNFFRRTKIDEEKDGKCQVGSQWSRWKFPKQSQPPSHPPLSYPCPEPWQGNSHCNFNGNTWHPRRFSKHQGFGHHTIRLYDAAVRCGAGFGIVSHSYHQHVESGIQKETVCIAWRHGHMEHTEIVFSNSSHVLMVQSFSCMYHLIGRAFVIFNRQWLRELKKGLPCWRRRVK